MTLVTIALAVCATWAWYWGVYVPERAYRQSALRILATSIELCFASSSPGEHLGLGGECYLMHDCSETDDLSGLNLRALHWVQDLADSLPQGAQYRLHWARRPTYHVCTDHGVRKTCLILRFYLRPVGKDPYA